MNDKSKKLLLAKRCHATGHSLLSDLGVLGKRNRADNTTLAQALDYRFSVPVRSIELGCEREVPKRIAEGGKLLLRDATLLSEGNQQLSESEVRLVTFRTHFLFSISRTHYTGDPSSTSGDERRHVRYPSSKKRSEKRPTSGTCENYKDAYREAVHVECLSSNYDENNARQSGKQAHEKHRAHNKGPLVTKEYDGEEDTEGYLRLIEQRHHGRREQEKTVGVTDLESIVCEGDDGDVFRLLSKKRHMSAQKVMFLCQEKSRPQKQKRNHIPKGVLEIDGERFGDGVDHWGSQRP